MDSLHQGFEGEGHKAGKKTEVKKTITSSKTAEKRSWTFDSGVINNCGKLRSTGGRGGWRRGYQKRHSTQRNTVQKQGKECFKSSIR